MVSETGYPLLLFADSEQDGDQLYFGQVFVPDPFFSFLIEGRRMAMVSRLEFARVVRESRFDEVLPLEAWTEKAKERFDLERARPLDVIRAFAEDRGLAGFRIPENFPAGLALGLKDAGFSIEVVDSPVFPERLRKTDAEADAIREGNDASAAGFRAVEEILAAAEIRDRKVIHDGEVLTSERLREAIDIACIRRGAVASHTIVAAGDQACDPHCRGEGEIPANSLIIVDIFPRVSRTGYWGDMTRTYLKGTPSPEQRRIVEAVRAAQQSALDAIAPGVECGGVHQGVLDVFERFGFENREKDGVHEGFIHSTGHGLGLDIHERPRLYFNQGKLDTGMVVTVEPGLYYPGVGACRIEDVVRVTEGGSELLSGHPYDWEFA